MKKFFRNLLSGYFLVLLLLLAQILLIVAVQLFSDDLLQVFGIFTEETALAVSLGYFTLWLISFIVAIIIFFKIIGKIEAPEFKIPWVVGLLIFPLFASAMFLIFGNHGLNKRDRKIIGASYAANAESFALVENEKKKYDALLGEAVGTFTYVNNVTRLGVHSGNRVTYFKSGEEFFPDMIEHLKKAEEFIFIEFFIISDGKLWSEVVDVLKERAAAGVDVRIVYDDMGSSGTISSLTPHILRRYGISCHKFHPFRPILSGVYNNRDHRKIVIVDHKFAYTGGMNLADEYANLIERFGYWKDTMVRLEGSAVGNLIVTFLQNYDLATGHVSRFNMYLSHEYPVFEDKGFVMPFGDSPGGIDDALIGEQTYINMLNYAKTSVYISTPYFIPTYALLDAIKNASLRGVDVFLIVPGIPDKKAVYLVSQSHFEFLLAAGVKIYLYTPGFNHMKTVLCDDKLAFVGTINFDFRSLVHHFECGTLLYDNPCVADIRKDFDEMISVSSPVPREFKLKGRQKRFCLMAKLIAPLL